MIRQCRLANHVHVGVAETAISVTWQPEPEREMDGGTLP
jgi:hypothetical protein